MPKVFEDEFMDAQANSVSLCMEFLENVQADVDKIYIYMYSDEGVFTFNAFFEKNKQILYAIDLTDKAGVRDFMRCGIEDVINIRRVCRAFEKDCPYEIKMIFDTKSHKFDAQYKYEPIDEEKDISPNFVFMNWENEIKNTFNK